MQRKVFPLLAICLSALVFSTAAFAQQRFSVSLNSQQEVPVRPSNGVGTCQVVLAAGEAQFTVTCTYSGVTSAVVGAHIHDAGPVGVNGPIRFNFNYTGGTSGTIGPLTFATTAAQIADLRAGRWYANIHTSNFTGGEIRGQVKPSNLPADYDGDGRTDVSVFRFSSSTLFTTSSLTNNINSFRFGTGTNADIFLNGVPDDFDGDGRSDVLLLSLPGGTATNAPLFWSVLLSGTNTIRTVQWGNFATANGERLAPGDYDGDGKTDFAVYRGATGIFYILESSTGNTRAERWGIANDIPSVGDFDKDGKTDLCVVRLVNGELVWFIRNSSNGQSRAVSFGASTDSLFFFAPIDVDGDGAQDISVNRTVNGQRVFYTLRSSDNQVYALTWGVATGAAATSDSALFGDYDGDGRSDFVARRTVSGQFVWYIYQSSTQTGRAVTFGTTNDQRTAQPLSIPISSDETFEVLD